MGKSPKDHNFDEIFQVGARTLSDESMLKTLGLAFASTSLIIAFGIEIQSFVQ